MKKWKKVISALLATCCLFTIAVTPVSASSSVDAREEVKARIVLVDIDGLEPTRSGVYYFYDYPASVDYYTVVFPATVVGARATLYASGWIDTDNITGKVTGRRLEFKQITSGTYSYLFNNDSTWIASDPRGEWAWGQYTVSKYLMGSYVSSEIQPIGIGFIA